MKNPPEESKRWLSQAQHDQETAKILFKEKRYSDVCYFCEQTSQKALKAYLYFKGERFINIHSVRALLEACVQHDSEFPRLFEEGGILDQYYLGPRYPDAVAPPAIPFEIFSGDQAKKALEICRKIITAVKKFIR